MKMLNFLLLCLVLAISLTGCATTPSTTLLSADVRAQPENYVVVAVRNDGISQTHIDSNVHGYAGGAYMQSARARHELQVIAADYQLTEVSGWPIPTLALQCVVFKKPDEISQQVLLAKLNADARVKLAQPLQSFATNTNTHPDADVDYNDPYAPMQTNLAQMSLRQAHHWSHGEHVRIAVIDTGVDVAHPDLQGRIVRTRNLVDNDAAQFLLDRHGTAMAGVIAANANNSIGMVGVAPEADLLALKACWQLRPDHDAAACNTYTLAQALMSAIDEQAQIINLSLTGPMDPLLKLLIEQAQRKGIIVVGAAGDATQVFPAQLDRVLAVASMEDINMENHAGEPALLHAPGRDVLSLRPGGGYDFVSGNSIATAEVSGAISLLLADKPAARLMRRMDIDQVRHALIQNGLVSDSHSYHAVTGHAAMAVAERK